MVSADFLEICRGLHPVHVKFETPYQAVANIGECFFIRWTWASGLKFTVSRSISSESSRILNLTVTQNVCHLKCDGLRAYRTFIERHAKLEITPVSCLTHLTWKFKEAGQEHPRIAARILLLTGSIYQIEKRLREENAGALNRQRARCWFP